MSCLPNKSMKTIRCFSWGKATLNKRAKPVNHLAAGFGNGGQAPGKSCKLEPPQSLDIAFLVLEKD